ncbi:MAG TPA: amino acid adenylation domain-containing protein [Clostridia bacterium]|nr:amino acid adenylation domain-containing protein [Clostridia bacterium]
MTNIRADYGTLIDVLENSIKLNKGITYINGDENDVFVGYDKLYCDALIVLYNLQLMGIKPGQELVFQIEKNEDFTNIFWACILGGIIAVPVTIGVNEEHRNKLLKILDILNDPLLIIGEEVYNKLVLYLKKIGLNEAYDKIKNRAVFVEDAYKKEGVGTIHRAQKNDIAFIQFSSGSTGEPKGVVLTHENLITNMAAITKAVGITSQDSSFGWMPLTHDLGLIGFHLTPLFAGINQYIMPTVFFITHPIKWLEKANQYRVSLLASPNFGYKHFLNFFNDDISRDWNLSCIRLIINGAEPISASLSNEFYNKMAAWGLKKEAAFPVYGMAEACVAVTFSQPGAGLIPVPVDRKHLSIGSVIKEIDNPQNRDALVFVELGYPVEDCFVRICDDEDRVLGDNIVGNIQIQGKNVTSGYYNNPDATSLIMTSDGWLRTGDLGFFKHGSLIVTGRKKDIIFVNGQNYYPHDIERVAEEVDGINIGMVASCGIYNIERQKEEIGIFVLYKRELQKFAQLALKIKSYINKQTGLEVGAVVPIIKMPKTTSGKIQRYILKEMYEAGEFTDVLDRLRIYIEEMLELRITEPPRDEFDEKVLNIWMHVLDINSISITDNFFELGGNSLKAAYIANGIYREFGVILPLKGIFEEPTIKALADYIKTADKTVYEPIEKIKEGQHYEVSSAEKRIFVLDQLNGNDISYNISQAIWIKGRIDKERFEYACRELVRRNESLRTYFTIYKGAPVQRVLQDIDFQFEYLKCEQSRLQETITAFIKPFDLGRAPLFRMGLFEVEAEKSIFMLDVHHIIADGTSVSILWDQFIKLYEGKQLEEPKIQYKDFAAWQNRQIESGGLNEKAQYWMNEFSGEIPVLELPYDYSRPLYQSFEGNKLSCELDKSTSHKLKVLAGKNGTSLFMLLLSAYYVLLKKYSNQEDIVVGTSVAGRIHPELDDMIGMFVNTLPLRNYPEGRKTFDAFLKEVKGNSLKAYENQSYQFELIVEKLNIKRDMSRNPLFDTMFVMQNMKTDELGGENHEFEIYPVNNHIAKFDLTFFAWELDKRICIEVEYCTKLFEEKTIERLLVHYLNILNEILENPALKISDIRMLSQEEMTKLVYGYNETGRAYPQNKTIIELIEEQAEKTPGNVALIWNDNKLTYEELKHHVNLFACLLRNRGLGRNDIVAIVSGRSIELVIAMLAVLKAGGAYLPIDPGYPSERINFMLKDSGAKLLLTQAQYIDKYEFEGDYIDICGEKAFQEQPVSLQNINMPEDLAYVIYTSGSTGKPKGVMLEHRNLVNYIIWAAKNYVKGESLNFPLYTTVSFDLTITSIYTPLITGNSVVIYGDDDQEVLIRKVIRENKAGIVKATPAHLRIIRNDDNTMSSIKRLIVGGEQLDTELAGRIQESFGKQIEIYNEYGPTEAAVGCMIYKFDKKKDLGANVPIGVPADNVQIYLLDKDMKPVPENVPGEKYISGDGISRGYLGRDELTADKFIENPFLEGKKMYRTGDLAKRLQGGNIEFIGRIDHQVKIRGYRIELGEIESQLLKHTLIEQAVVVDRETVSGDKYLAAYLKSSTDIAASELREYLINELPEYMVPSYFVKLNEIPLTINGKVDKKALPEPNEFISRDNEYIAPENEREVIFAGIWADILGVSRVGVLDNYFSLGGDSIKAIQIASRLSQSGIDISVKNILTYQTIRQCCLNCKEDSNIKEYEQGLIEGSIGFTPIVQWFSALKLKSPNYYDQSVLLRFKEKVDVEKLGQTLTKIVEHHDGLRLNLESERDALYFNNNHLKTGFNVEIFDISGFSKENQALEMERIGIDLKSSFDMEKSLLIKCAVINADENEQYVLLAAHHIVVDGVSWRIILEDFYNIYISLKNGKAITMLQKTASMSDWHDWLTSYLKSKELADSRSYWQNLCFSKFKLPLDKQRSEWSNHSKSIIGFELGERDTCKLLKESHKAYNTDVKDLLITALVRTLRDWTGMDEIVIELEGHGRHFEDIDVSRTVGWFTSIYPVRFIAASDDVSEQIKSVKEELRGVPNEGIDYGILRNITHDINDEVENLAQVRFNYLGQFDNEVENELFSYANNKTGDDVGMNNDMTAILEINCMVVKGQLEFNMNFNNKAFEEETLQSFSTNYLTNLEYIIDHVLNRDDVYFTPSDFETIEIKQEDLDILFD